VEKNFTILEKKCQYWKKNVSVLCKQCYRYFYPFQAFQAESLARKASAILKNSGMFIA
jgi:hypothetical protein